MRSCVIAFFVLPLALACAAMAVAPQDQTVRRGESTWTMYHGELLPIEDIRNPDQTLETVVQDPDHPDEPWTVTTYRRDGESELAFALRHEKMVEAVRELLSDDEPR